MKKILILTSNIEDQTKKDFVKMVSSYFKDKKIEVVSKEIRKVLIIADNSHQVLVDGENVKNYSLVVFRGIRGGDMLRANSVAIFLEHIGVRFVDRIYINRGVSGNKMISLSKLCVNGLPIPKTIFWTGEIGIELFDTLSESLGLPFVAKSLTKERGRGVFLIKDINDFKKLKESCLFQKVIEKDHEYRVLVLGGEVGVFEEKIATSKGEFRNNVALGADEIFMNKNNIPLNIKEVAIKSANVLDLNIAGVDILVEKKTGKPYLLEVNRGPGLTYDTKISPEFREIAEYLERVVENPKIKV